MPVTCVEVCVKKEHINDFIAATEKNHLGSVCETEKLRFDVLQSADDPCKFLLYEAYANEYAKNAHKETAHYLKWRETVEPWMEKPRKGTPYKLLFPNIAKR